MKEKIQMCKNKRDRQFVGFLLIVISVSLLSVVSWAAEIILKVNTGTARIRSKPDLESSILTLVPSGTLLSSSSKEGVWYKVALPPDPSGLVVFGYIHESLVTPLVTSPPQAETPRVVQRNDPIDQPVPKPAAVPIMSPSRRKTFQIRPYAKVGMLLTPPSALDLGYANADSSVDMDQYLDVSPGNFGAGAQFFFASPKNPNLKFGLDLGFQKLMSSRFDTGAADLSFIYQDYYEDSEFDISLLGIVELFPPGSPFLFQGGLGGHFVAWSYRHVYESKYQPLDETTESGMTFNFGLMAAAGTNIQAGDRISIPILLRLDYIMRYRGYITACLVLGFTFN